MTSREEFERWIKSIGVGSSVKNLTRGDRDYNSYWTEAAWQAWQHQQARIDELRDLLRSVHEVSKQKTEALKALTTKNEEG